MHQPLAGNGTITVRVTSLTGLVPAANLDTPSPTLRPGTQEWAKAGIIIKQSLKPGSEYAAMMVAAGHGVRMQWNYTADRPGLPGTVGPANPRWLRLTRAGDVITGYDSADGTHWVKVGAVTLPGLPSTVQVGLFAASPDDNPEVQHLGGGIQGGGGPTQATAVIDHVSGVPRPVGGHVHRGRQRVGDRGRQRIGDRAVSPGRRPVHGDRIRRHRAGPGRATAGPRPPPPPLAATSWARSPG